LPRAPEKAIIKTGFKASVERKLLDGVLQMQCHSSFQLLAALKVMKPVLTSLQVHNSCVNWMDMHACDFDIISLPSNIAVPKHVPVWCMTSSLK